MAKKLKSLNKVDIITIKSEIDTISASLNGISGLLAQGVSNPGYDGEEIYGLGQLLKKLLSLIHI